MLFTIGMAQWVGQKGSKGAGCRCHPRYVLYFVHFIPESIQKSIYF